jgi:hypothetical protein
MFAGVLFPGSAWFGITAVTALPGLLVHRKTRIVGVLAAATASLILNAERKPVNIPRGREVEMTRIHREQREDSLAEFFIEDRLQNKSHARFLVFPEAAQVPHLDQLGGR